MALIERAIPFSALQVADTWNLVRGLGAQTYNVADQFNTSQSGWSIDTPVAGVSISNVGVLSITPAHAYAGNPTEITVDTDDNSIIIPIAMRNYFPDDYDEADQTRFYSAFRSIDPSARDLWLADYFSPVSPAAFTTAEVTARSGDNGYIDIDALEVDCAAIGDNGILEVKTIYDHLTVYNGPFHINHDADRGDRMLAGYMVDGSLTMLLQNGHPYFRSVWSPAGLNSNWTAADRSNSQYDNSVNSSFDDYHGIMMVIRRHGGTGEILRSGDFNSYPGLKTIGNNGLQYSTYNRPSDIVPSNAEIQSWFMYIGDSIRDNLGNTNYRRDHHFYGLTGTVANTISPTNTLSGQQHNGGGIEVEAGEWDWAELMIYNQEPGFAPGQDYEATKERLVNNLVHVIGGASFTY